MPQIALQDLIDELALSSRVKGIFTTGTTATGLTTSSDIDLVVILDKNSEEIKSAYTMIEERFADIFFFDSDFVTKCKNMERIPANAFEGMFITWLAKGKIYKDDTGVLFELKEDARAKMDGFIIPDEEKQDSWFKINYSFIANTRYFNAENDLYHKALELRLLYSISELIVAYFTFRNIPWRGEKSAIAYLEEHDTRTYECFTNFLESSSLEKRFNAYQDLFHRTSFANYQQWNDDFLVVLNSKHHVDESLTIFWNQLRKSKNAKKKLG